MSWSKAGIFSARCTRYSSNRMSCFCCIAKYCLVIIFISASSRLAASASNNALNPSTLSFSVVFLAECRSSLEKGFISTGVGCLLSKVPRRLWEDVIEVFEDAGKPEDCSEDEIVLSRFLSCIVAREFKSPRPFIELGRCVLDDIDSTASVLCEIAVSPWLTSNTV